MSNMPHHTAACEQKHPAIGWSWTTQLGCDMEPDGISAQCYSSLIGMDLDEADRHVPHSNRIDNRYLITSTQLTQLLKAVASDYAILQVNGVRQFAYATCYYPDTFGCTTQRSVNSSHTAVAAQDALALASGHYEIGIDRITGNCSAHPDQQDVLVTDAFDSAFMCMLKNIYRPDCSRTTPFSLHPSLIVGFTRSTLIHRNSGDRIIIDSKLCFDQPGIAGQPYPADRDLIVVETRSADGSGRVDSLLSRLGADKTSASPKYCIGINLNPNRSSCQTPQQAAFVNSKAIDTSHHQCA